MLKLWHSGLFNQSWPRWLVMCWVEWRLLGYKSKIENLFSMFTFIVHKDNNKHTQHTTQHTHTQHTHKPMSLAVIYDITAQVTNAFNAATPSWKNICKKCEINLLRVHRENVCVEYILLHGRDSSQSPNALQHFFILLHVPSVWLILWCDQQM